MDVVGARLAANQHHVLAALLGSCRVVSSEIDSADRGARRGAEARGQHDALAREVRMEHGVEVIGRHAGERLLTRDLPPTRTRTGALGHVDGHLQRGGTRALADACLQHPELALLDGELGVAHVGVVRFETPEDLEEVGVDHREVLLHVVEVFGVADTRHHVLALRVHEEVPVGLVLAGRRVAREADAGARVVVAVAEHHRLDVDGGAEVVVDLLAVSVRDRAGAVPALEHGLDGAVQLLAGLLRERCTGLLQNDRLVVLTQLLERVGRDQVVHRSAGLGLGGVEGMLERLAVDSEHDPAVHGDEPAVRVVGEPGVVGRMGEAFDALVVEAEVQDGVHHARHRELGARTDADEQRIERIAELATHCLLELEDMLGDLFVEARRPAAVHVVATGIGGNRESRRDGKLQDAGHLGQVGPLASQQVLVLHRRAAVLVFEGVDVWHAKGVYDPESHPPERSKNTSPRETAAADRS